VRRWPTCRDALPGAPLIAMIPVSVRDPGSKGALGNKVSAMLAMLPTNVHEPEKRLEIAHAATRLAQAQQAALPQGLVEQITDFALPALTPRAPRGGFATGLPRRLPAVNVTLSNVPGPNVPVYLCGAKLLAHYPLSVITAGQGLNITLVGYLGKLHFGLTSCRELVPDLDTLASYLVDELELQAKAASPQPDRATRKAQGAGAASARAGGEDELAGVRTGKEHQQHLGEVRDAPAHDVLPRDEPALAEPPRELGGGRPEPVAVVEDEHAGHRCPRHQQRQVV